MSYKVFISYSWSNTAERRALTSELEGLESVEVLVDEAHIGAGVEIHSTISTMIDHADCVLILFTAEALRSREVLDEATRCHERGRFMIPIVAEDTNLDSLPWFIRDKNLVGYDPENFTQVIELIVKAVSERVFARERLLRAARRHERLRALLDDGNEVLYIPAPPSLRQDLRAMRPLVFELQMAETGKSFVVCAAAGMKVGEAAGFLIDVLLPHLKSELIDWSFWHNQRHLPSHHTLGTSSIRLGDIVYLDGAPTFEGNIRPCIVPPDR
jgi:hypothetical protein